MAVYTLHRDLVKTRALGEWGVIWESLSHFFCHYQV